MARLIYSDGKIITTQYYPDHDSAYRAMKQAYAKAKNSLLDRSPSKLLIDSNRAFIKSDSFNVCWLIEDDEKNHQIRLETGVLDVSESPDSEYPGVDIEFIADSEDPDSPKTRPRVLIEQHDSQLRCLIWSNADSEDYTTAVYFLDAKEKGETHGRQNQT